jgi:hypothetical protein
MRIPKPKWAVVSKETLEVTVDVNDQFRLYTNRKSARISAWLLNTFSDKPIVFVEKYWG